MYQPRIDRFQVTPDASHDSTIAWFGDRWIAQSGGGSEQPGQRIYQSISHDLKTWAEPIEVYSTPAGSSNPIEAPPEQKQWQPGFVKVGDELWSFWVTSGGGPHALYFSRLTHPDGKWEHRVIFGWDSQGDDRLPNSDALTQTLFGGNGGIVATRADGGERVVVPVTLRATHDRSADNQRAPSYDTAIYSDDGGETWHLSKQPTTLKDVERASWEATIWQPAASRGVSPRSEQTGPTRAGSQGDGSQGDGSPAAEPGTIWMIARNGTSRRIQMNEAQAWSVSRDSGATWQDPKLILPMELANSRSYVTTYGPRNILVQSDYWTPADTHWTQRKDLSLFYSRGGGPAFVAGTLLVGWGMHWDYPQMADHGNIGAVTYTQREKNSFQPQDRTQWLARIDPLPDPDRYYLFPRTGRGHVAVRRENGSSSLVFDSGLGSAGIDIDANDSAEDTLKVALRFRIDEAGNHPMTLFHPGHPAARLVADAGVVRLVADEQSVELGEVANGWNAAEFESGGGEPRARLDGGAWAAVSHEPTFRWPYLGRGLYEDAPKRATGRFSIDIGSVRTRVHPTPDR